MGTERVWEQREYGNRESMGTERVEGIENRGAQRVERVWEQRE